MARNGCRWRGMNRAVGINTVPMPSASGMGYAGTRGGLAFAIVTFLIAAIVPSKEVAFGLAAILLVVFRPLNFNQIRLILLQTWPVLLMLAIGLVMTLVDVTGEMDKRAAARIIFYYVRIPTFLLLGFAARRYLTNDRPLLWAIVILGIWGAGQTLFRYVTGGNLSELGHNEIRAVVGGGDTVSLFIPVCMLTLWPRTQDSAAKAVLIGASGIAVLGVLAASSRTGLMVMALTTLLSVPRVSALLIARWGSVALLVATFVLTTPALPPLLHALGIEPLRIDSLAEVIARPRSDLQSINNQWRGYETYMAFIASVRDGLFPFLMGHGMSVYAPLGVLIELAPGQMFDRTDIFHNGWSFIILHSGLIGVFLYIGQFFLWARAPVASGGRTLRRDNRFFALLILSLSSSTAVVAGAFNAGSFASIHMFLLGFFYPFSLVPIRLLTQQRGASTVQGESGALLQG